MDSNSQGADTRDEETKILAFLQKDDSQYSESRLIGEVFGVKIIDESLPSSQDELDRVMRIREVLKKLVKEKKIYAAKVEDPETKEEEWQYSAKGFYATP